MGTELGGPLNTGLPAARDWLLAIELASDVVIRDVRLEIGVGGTLVLGNGTPVGKGMALVPKGRARAGAGVGLEVVEGGKTLFVDENELEREWGGRKSSGRAVAWYW